MSFCEFLHGGSQTERIEKTAERMGKGTGGEAHEEAFMRRSTWGRAREEGHTGRGIWEGAHREGHTGRGT